MKEHKYKTVIVACYHGGELVRAVHVNDVTLADAFEIGQQSFEVMKLPCSNIFITSITK